MCIAIYKPIGAKFPGKKTLKRCFNGNPDGFGWMRADGERVTIQKGYMTMDAFLSQYDKIKDDTERAYVLHFRITTHGGTSQAMSQPFPLSRSLAELTATTCTADVGIAHNGIISMCGYADYISDTAEYIRRYMMMLYDSHKKDFTSEALNLIEYSIDGSRLAILYGDGRCDLLGEWHHSGGCYFSNESYQKPKRTIPKTYAPSVYRYDWRDDYYDEPSAWLDYSGDDAWTPEQWDAWARGDGVPSLDEYANAAAAELSVALK